MPSATALKAKQLYNEKMQKLLESHDKAFLVHADNVGSKQFMDIRTVRSARQWTARARDGPSSPGGLFFFRVLWGFAVCLASCVIPHQGYLTCDALPRRPHVGYLTWDTLRVIPYPTPQPY